MKPTLNLIVAYAHQGVIGKDNDMPWRLPNDLAYFKKTTLGCPIIMGRKTRESLGPRPLPGRLNIAISRDANFQADGTTVVQSLDAAIELAQQQACEKVFIIGGGEIYRQSLSRADAVYATEIKADFEGDTYFPKLDAEHWQEISRDPQEPQNGLAFDFVVYQRRA